MANLPDGWFYDADIAFYRRTFESLPDGAMTLEIGCWKGRSICSVADIIKKKNITAYVVDTFKGTESERETAHKEAKEIDIEAVFRKAVADFGITENVKVITDDMRTLKWGDYSIPDKFFDFIFLDGDHTTDAVIHDINKCLPKLKKDGVFAGHDILWETVKAAVNKVFGEKYSVPFPGSNIWQKTTELKMDENTILMSCWAKPLRTGGWNAKNPSKEYWAKLMKLLKEKGYTVWQVGQGEELKLKTADAHIWDKDLWLLGEDIKNCKAWISIDNFFHHWALIQFKKPGIVLWGQSDPSIFGHEGNINLLKDKNYLRQKQFAMWEDATYDPETFVSPEKVVEAVEELINKGGR